MGKSTKNIHTTNQLCSTGWMFWAIQLQNLDLLKPTSFISNLRIAEAKIALFVRTMFNNSLFHKWKNGVYLQK